MSAVRAPLPAASADGHGPLLALFRHVSGPDTTGAEAVVQLVGIVAFTALALAAAAARAPGWSALQWALAAAIAFDFSGGVVANATGAAKRRAHRPGRGRARALFYAGHLHPLLLAWAFSVPWAQAGSLYVGMLAAAAAVELSPRRVVQPVAFCAVALGLVAASAAPWPIGLEWFAPVYLLKLVAAHAVPPSA